MSNLTPSGYLLDIKTAVEAFQALADDTNYETIAASQTDQMCGATGAIGDKLVGLLVIPATLSPGAISIEDGATNIPVFTGGADSILTLHPFFISFGAGIKCLGAGWEITTGAAVACIAVGNFT